MEEEERAVCEEVGGACDQGGIMNKSTATHLYLLNIFFFW